MLHEEEEGKAKCPKEATIAFETITITLDVPPRGRQVGKPYTGVCGPTAGNPMQEVMIDCEKTESGYAFRKLYGICKSVQRVKEENVPECPEREFSAQWAVEGAPPVTLHFKLEPQKNPSGKDMAVTVPCPDSEKMATFKCTEAGKWDIRVEDTKACAKLENRQEQEEAPTEAPKEQLAPGTFPCKLTKEDVTLEGDKPGFAVEVSCSDDVEDAGLTLPGYREKLYGKVGKGEYRLTVQDPEDFEQGAEIVLHGSYEGKSGSTNAIRV